MVRYSKGRGIGAGEFLGSRFTSAIVEIDGLRRQGEFTMPSRWSHAFYLNTIKCIVADIRNWELPSVEHALLHNYTTKWSMWFHDGTMAHYMGNYEVPPSVVRDAWELVNDTAVAA